MENNTILKFDGLSKKFGNKTVVDHISLEIKEGEIFGLLGPNGAGKSTTLNMVCSLLKPTSGNIEIFGMKTSERYGNKNDTRPEKRILLRRGLTADTR